MDIRRLGILGAAFLGAAAFGYTSLTHEPLVQAAGTAHAPGDEARASDTAYTADMQRPRECDRSRNIDTECTYQ